MYKILAFSCLFFGFWTFSAFASLEPIIQTHLLYLSPQWFFQSSNTWGKQTIWNSFQDSKHFISTDLSTLLSSPKTRESRLVTYLSMGENILNSLGYQQHLLTLSLQNHDNKLAQCTADLNHANQIFTNSFETNDESLFTQAVQQAQEANSCIGRENTFRHATLFLQKKVQALQKVISLRQAYLEKNKTLIIHHYDILKPSLLSELYNISLSLEAMKPYRQ